MNSQFIKSNKGNYIPDLYLTTPDIFKDEEDIFMKVGIEKSFKK